MMTLLGVHQLERVDIDEDGRPVRMIIRKFAQAIR
jgi:hypothetical protein